MKSITFLLILFSLTVSFKPYAFADEFNFDYDYCVFQGEGTKLYMEFYYSFFQGQLKFLKTDNGYEADGGIYIDIIDKHEGLNIISKKYKVPIVIEDTAGYDMTKKLTGQLNFLLDTGLYSFEINANDFNDTTHSKSISVEIALRTYGDSVRASGIQLASNIFKTDDKNSIFYKNTLEVVPNPSGLFGNNLSKLFYYFELYNLKKEFITEKYFITATLYDKENIQVASETKNYILKSESKVEYGHFDVTGLKTGKHSLVIALISDKNVNILETEKEFWIFNSSTELAQDENLMSEDAVYLNSEYPSYTDEELEMEYKYTIYIMKDVLRTWYDKLNDTELKKRFMFKFWKNLDPNPSTPLNEFKQEYLKRAEYSNKNFRNNFIDGWRTDRGRVHMIYGKCDDVERHLFEADTRAYEIWTYDRIEGGVIFVFIDISNNDGNYVLVHSTARNELRDDDWRRRLNIKR